MTKNTKVNAAILIIGNEILSGRTQDTNTSSIALWLNSIGVKVDEVRVIPDIENIIVDTVNHLRKTNDYVLQLVVLDLHMTILLLNQYQKHSILNMKFIKKHLKY